MGRRVWALQNGAYLGSESIEGSGHRRVSSGFGGLSFGLV